MASEENQDGGASLRTFTLQHMKLANFQSKAAQLNTWTEEHLTNSQQAYTKFTKFRTKIPLKIIQKLYKTLLNYRVDNNVYYNNVDNNDNNKLKIVKIQITTRIYY